VLFGLSVTARGVASTLLLPQAHPVLVGILRQLFGQFGKIGTNIHLADIDRPRRKFGHYFSLLTRLLSTVANQNRIGPSGVRPQRIQIKLSKGNVRLLLTEHSPL
jgi:hypothetical protein